MLNNKKTIAIIGTGSFVFNDNFGEGVILRSIYQYLNENEYKNFNIAVYYRNKNKLPYLIKKIENLKFTNIELIHIDLFEECLKTKNIYATFICVPDPIHHYFLKIIIEYNIPIWIVKPITDNLNQALEIEKLSNEKNTLIWVDYHKRFDISNRLLKKNIEKNTYGKVLTYSVQYTQPLSLPNNTFAWTASTNVLSYIGCHYIDQLEFLYEDKIKSFKVSAIGTKGILYNKFKNRCYDTILCTLVLTLVDSSVILCNFQIGWNDPEGTPSKSHQRVEVVFEKGRLIMDQKERGLELWDENKLHQQNPYFFMNSYDPIKNKETYSGYGYDSVKGFLSSVKEGVKDSRTLPFIKNILFSEYVLDKANISLDKEGDWIEYTIKN